MKIERMTHAHIDAVKELLDACFDHAWSAEGITSELEKRDTVCVVCEDNGEVVGYLAFEKILDEGAVAELAVSPRYRRQGIARRMLTQTMREAGELRLITLEVRLSNTPAIALYRSLGFEIAGRRRNYYDSPVEDALIMNKEIREV